MPTLTAGSSGLAIDLSTKTIVTSGVAPISFAVIRAPMTNGYHLDLTGTFTFTNGTLTAGMLSELSEWSGSTRVYSVTGLTADATDAVNTLVGDGWSSFHALLFSASDGMTGGAASDRLLGGAGNDFLSGGDSGDFLYGGPGNDFQEGGAGDDAMDGGLGNDTLFGGADNDALGGAAGADVLQGEAGNDYVLGGEDNDQISGGAGADALRGQPGDDTISGGDGDDRIWGDKGTNAATGGAGADQFVFFAGAGQTTVTDFSFADGDRVAFEGGTAAYTVSTDNGSAVIDFGGGTRAVLQGIAAAAVTSDWILFL